MNIWFAADIPDDSFGGVGRSMKELSEGLQKRGCHVSIITRATLPASNYLLFALRLCGHYILNLFNRPDWIIARSTDALFCAVVIRLFKLKTGIILHNHGWEEYVYTIESKLPRSSISIPTTWKSAVIRFPLLRLMLSLCTHCMSGTRHEMNYIRNRYRVEKHKLIYVPNGVSVSAKPFWKEQNDYPYHFLSVGNVTWKKNLIHTLKTFSLLRNSLPEARLTCIGTGVNDMEFCRYTDSDLEGVTNISSVHFDEMNTWYTTCPFMIISSRYEGGHSLAILEAMSHGIIVFASGIPSNREIIQDGSNGYLITGSNGNYDAGKINQKINLSANREIREAAIATAGHYNWDQQITRLENTLCRKP